MKVTIDIRDEILMEIDSIATARGTTVSVIVEEAVRRLLAERSGSSIDLPRLHLGRALVSIDDRDALYEAMADRED